MTNAISLEETYDDEPMPKAATLTISGSDAKALDDFVRHVSIRCYDERFDGGGKKSRELSLQLERMREILDTLLDYPEIEESYYWINAQDMQADEAVPDLLAAVADDQAYIFIRSAFTLLPIAFHRAHYSSRSTTRRARPAGSSACLCGRRLWSAPRHGRRAATV